jgi:hypothetical protein
MVRPGRYGSRTYNPRRLWFNYAYLL